MVKRKKNWIATKSANGYRNSSNVYTKEDNWIILVIAAILNDPINKTHNLEYNPSEIKIPNRDEWTIVLWHFNRDSLTEYSKKTFHCSWKVAKNLFIRVYSKELKLRMEIQENPDTTFKQLITQFIRDGNKTRLIELLN